MSLLRIGAIWGLAMVMVAGCASRSPSPEYYRLILSAGIPDNSLSGFSLVVGPTSIPERLDKEDIQQPGDSGMLTGSDLKRWSEPLDDALSQELAWYLGGRAPEMEVVAYPWPAGIKPDVQVSLQVTRFEVMPSGHLELSGTLILSSLHGNELQQTQRFMITEQVSEPTVSQLVAAHNRAATQLGEKILELLGKALNHH